MLAASIASPSSRLNDLLRMNSSGRDINASQGRSTPLHQRRWVFLGAAPSFISGLKESRNSVMADITRIRIASGRWMAGRLSLDWLELWFCFDRRHRSFGLLKLNVIMQALMARH